MLRPRLLLAMLLVAAAAMLVGLAISTLVSRRVDRSPGSRPGTGQPSRPAQPVYRLADV